MHATPLNAEVTLLGFSKSNPLCSIRGGSCPILHPPSAGNWDERYGKRTGKNRERASAKVPDPFPSGTLNFRPWRAVLNAGSASSSHALCDEIRGGSRLGADCCPFGRRPLRQQRRFKEAMILSTQQGTCQTGLLVGRQAVRLESPAPAGNEKTGQTGHGEQQAITSDPARLR